MKKNYKDALVEVNEVLKYTDTNLVNKIPLTFKNFIKDNMSNDYSFSINNSEETIFKKETQTILSLIYRNYFCSKEEKAYLLECEKQEKRKYNNV